MSADQLIAQMREAAAEGLNVLNHRHIAVATPLTPLQYGDLRSGHTPVPATPDNLESASVNDVQYAVIVHEDLTARHPIGQAKFFEEAAIQVQPEAEAILAAPVRRRFA
jgi:hypothetical protein